MQDFRLEKYLSDGVERILRGILRVSDPRGSFFMLKFMAAEKRARRLREIAKDVMPGPAEPVLKSCMRGNSPVHSGMIFLVRQKNWA